MAETNTKPTPEEFGTEPTFDELVVAEFEAGELHADSAHEVWVGTPEMVNFVFTVEGDTATFDHCEEGGIHLDAETNEAVRDALETDTSFTVNP